jgi:hypothetical protein
MKQGSSKKGVRSGRNKRKGVYEAQRRRTTMNKHRRAIKRDKAHKFFAANPDKGSPSQLRNRPRYRNAAINRIKRKRKAGGKEAYEAFTGGSYENYLAARAEAK